MRGVSDKRHKQVNSVLRNTILIYKSTVTVKTTFCHQQRLYNVKYGIKCDAF
jgi:hypothetical protein